MSRRATLADYGLVGSVGGLLAMVGSGIGMLAVSASLNRVATFFAALLGLSTLLTLISLVIVVVTARRPEGPDV